MEINPMYSKAGRRERQAAAKPVRGQAASTRSGGLTPYSPAALRWLPVSPALLLPGRPLSPPGFAAVNLHL